MLPSEEILELATQAGRAWRVIDPAVTQDDYASVACIGILQAITELEGNDGWRPDSLHGFLYNRARQQIIKEIEKCRVRHRWHSRYNRFGQATLEGGELCDPVSVALAEANPEHRWLEQLIVGQDMQAFFDETWLTEEQAQVIELRMRGLSFPDIQKHLGATAGAVRARYRGAVRAIRLARGVDPDLPIPHEKGVDRPVQGGLDHSPSTFQYKTMTRSEALSRAAKKRHAPAPRPGRGVCPPPRPRR